jgi:MFS family permease
LRDYYIAPVTRLKTRPRERKEFVTGSATHRGKVLEFVLLGSGAFSYLPLIVMIPALPLIEAAFPHEPHAEYLTKFIVSAASIAVILVSLFSGPLVDRLGRRRSLIVGYFLFVVVGTMGAALASLPAIIASRFFVGGAGALIFSTAVTLIADAHVGLARDRRIGIFHGFASLVIGLLVPFAGYLADLGWHWVFLIHLIGVPMLICAIVSGDLKRVDEQIAKRRTISRQYSARFPDNMVPLGALALLTGIFLYSLPIYIPFHLREIGAYTGQRAGGILSINLLCSILTGGLYGEVRRRVSQIAMLRISFAGAAVGIAIIAYAQSPLGVALGLIVVGSTGGFLSPNFFGMAAASTTEANRPTAIGLIKCLLYSGAFLGPAILQPIYQRFGVDAAILLLSLLATLLFVASYFVMKFACFNHPTSTKSPL